MKDNRLRPWENNVLGECLLETGKLSGNKFFGEHTAQYSCWRGSSEIRRWKRHVSCEVKCKSL